MPVRRPPQRREGASNSECRLGNQHECLGSRVATLPNGSDKIGSEVFVPAGDRAMQVTMTTDSGPVIRVGGKAISQSSPAFVVAEAACNHMSRMDYAVQLVDAAAEAGADAIKFQSYTAEKLTSKTAEGYGNIGTQSQYEYYRQFDRFGRSEYDELFDHAREKGLVPFSTPFDPENAQMLNSVQVDLFKIASCDLLYTDLLREVACFNKPVVISSGGASLDEIRRALDTLGTAGASEIVLLACTMAYPTRTEDAHYRRILTLRREFPECLVGVSDHVEPDPHMITGAVCVALGAVMLEKHFALARDMGGGSAISMTPEDLRAYVANVRRAEESLGSDEVKVYTAEEETRRSARRSLVAQSDLVAGTLLSREMLGVKRPGTGIGPEHIDDIVGRRLVRDLASEVQLEWKDLEQ